LAVSCTSAHAQYATYLEPVQETGDWNPSDFAIQLTRRARGLPFWFSLATFGTAAYSAAIERTLEVARYAARAIDRRQILELVNEPALSVVCFRRIGWERADYYAWPDRLLTDGLGFVTPTIVRGETAARFAIVNPVTSEADIDSILDTMC
jgi:glutamate/tyrosine decarboxylase-like PLP-dependent enzyme